MMTETKIDLFRPNDRNRLKTVLLGNVPTPADLKEVLGRPIPKIIEQLLIETHEDLETIKNKYKELGVEVIMYPVVGKKENFLEDTINVRNGFIVVDDQMFVTSGVGYLEELYNSVNKLVQVPHRGSYCPDIYLHDDYAILDRLGPKEYRYWRDFLSAKGKKIITAFNKGHSDGIYRNVGDKIWLVNGDTLDCKGLWPDTPVMELSTTSNGEINHWHPVEQLREMQKTRGRYLIDKQVLSKTDIEFVDNYLENWVGYCEETLFDINMSIIDENNIMVISRNSKVYDRLESLDINVHKVPFRHYFFWDAGLHCMTNDLVREK